MKIAVFHNLPPGGAKRVLYEEVKTLSKKHDLYLFIFDSRDEIFLDIRSFCKGVKTYKYDFGRNVPSVFSRIDKDYSDFFRLKAIHKNIAQDIDKNNFDVCLVHPDKFTQAPFLLRFLRTPSLYYCHELLRFAYEKELEFKENVLFIKKCYENTTRIIRKNVDRENARKATVMLANSNYTVKKAKSAYYRDVKLCYPGVDTSIFKPAGRKRKQVVFVGRWGMINGYETAREAVEIVRKNTQFVFKKVIFSKERSDNQLAKEYSESMITLCTSYNEPFGLTPIESMACETPVLAVNDGGYKETVVDGKTGFLLPRSPKAFAEKIYLLIRNSDIVKKMGKLGRKYTIANWNWKKHNEKLERLLTNVGKTRL